MLRGIFSFSLKARREEKAGRGEKHTVGVDQVTEKFIYPLELKAREVVPEKQRKGHS